MKAIVTGGCGFIGTHIVSRLLDEGHSVAVFDIVAETPYAMQDDYCVETIDICDYEETKKLVAFHQPDVVFHLAAKPRVQFSIDNPIETNLANINGTLHLLKACHAAGVRRFVYSSSSSVYGDQDRQPLIETMNPNPMSPYALQKLAGEYYTRLFHTVYGMETVSLRYFNCYDDKTEILTKTGFKCIKDVEHDDYLATLNPKTHVLEYHKPIAIQKLRHQDKMYNFKGRFIDLLVTPGHDMYVADKQFAFSKLTAQDIERQKRWDVSVYQSCNWGGEACKFKELPDTFNNEEQQRLRSSNKKKKIEMSDWLVFLGWFLTEGSVFQGQSKSYGKVHDYHRITITQSIKHKKYVALIKQAIKKIGFHYTTVVNNRNIFEAHIHSRQLFDELKCFRKNKFIPRYVLDLPTSDLKSLFSILMLGGGTKGRNRFTTKYRQFANDFQELLLKIGKVGRVREEKNHKKNVVYRIDFSDKIYTRLGRHDTQKLHLRTFRYNGHVYDVTVPNHIIFVRRNGIVCWSGNCYGPGQKADSSYAALIPAFSKMLIDKVQPVIYGDGTQTRDFTYIDDVVAANMKAATTDNPECFGEAFNVGAANSQSVNHVAEKLVELSGSKLAPRHGAPVIEPHDTLAYVGKARRLLDWSSLVSFNEGIVSTFHYFKTVYEAKTNSVN